MKLYSITRKQLLASAGGVALIMVLLLLFFWERHSAAAQFITVKVDTGSIRCLVNATGTVQAVNTIQVGSQISGTVAALNADFNSRVSKGQILAQLDPAVYQAGIAQARANLTDAQARTVAAEAELANEQAGVSGADANLAALRMERNDASDYLRQQQDLSASGVIAARDLETALNNF
jgi:HlyD family secretion protein